MDQLAVPVPHDAQHFELRDGDGPGKKVGGRVPIPALAPEDDARALKCLLGLVCIAERGLTEAPKRGLALGQGADEGFAGLVEGG